mgnify:CR=1 FL=1
MISYVAGELVATTATSVIIDHQGIGLEVLVPDSLLSKMPVAGSQVKIYTDFSVREDAMQLFGFATQADQSRNLGNTFRLPSADSPPQG